MITSCFTGYSLLLVVEASLTGPNVSIPMSFQYGTASHWCITQADKVS